MMRKAVGAVGVLFIFILLIWAGVFDPQPLGTAVWQQTLPPQTIPAGSQQIIWLDRDIPEGDYTVQVTAVWQSGEQDIAYGLLLGTDQQNLVVEISPLGYLSLLPPPSSPFASLPLQPWPHVQSGNIPNEIWVDVENGRFTVRINRELLWQGDVGQLDGSIGWVGQSFGETAVIQLHYTLFATQ